MTTNPDGSKSFVVVADVRGKQKERLDGFGGNNGKPCEIVPVGAVAQHDPHFVVAQKWTVFGDGNVACQSEIRSRGRVMELARIGYRFTLDKGLGKVSWFGAGPFENYPDRRSGAFTGWWSTGVDGMVERYAKPQDMGMRCVAYGKLRHVYADVARRAVCVLGDSVFADGAGEGDASAGAARDRES